MIQTQNNISFGSKLTPTNTLKRVMYDAFAGNLDTEDTAVLTKAINSLMNDGQNDVIQITEKTKGCNSFVETLVNGTAKSKYSIFSANYIDKSKKILRAIKDLASEKNPRLNLNALSSNEINALEPELKGLQEVVNKQKPDPDMFNIFDKISDIRDKMDIKRYKTNLNELHNLENKIFDINC